MTDIIFLATLCIIAASSAFSLFWVYSGLCVLMLVVGGVGTQFGPIVGAMAYILIQEILSSYTEDWMFFSGIIFVLMVLFMPGGIVGFLSSRGSKDRQTSDLSGVEGEEV